MKTTVAKASTVEKKWYIIDAKDQVLGRMCTVIANKLRGKDKAIFTPHLDCGDFIIVINASELKLTGAKIDKKLYSGHSGFPGGYKEENAKKLMGRKPEKLIELAIKGMLPKNKLRKDFLRKLKIYPGAEHPHFAQTPEPLEV